MGGVWWGELKRKIEQDTAKGGRMHEDDEAAHEGWGGGTQR